MKDTGIFYGSSSGKTESVALRIYQKLGRENAVVKDIADSSLSDLLACKTLILGVPTWGIGQVQDDWQDFASRLNKLDLNGRRVAIFGLGDQESYPESFADAIGKLYDFLKPSGCEIIGNWSTQGYEFHESKAVREGRFVGLVLDEENQPEMTELRINGWLQEIFPEWSPDLKA